MLFLLVYWTLVTRALSQGQPTAFTDVCVAEEYVTYRDELCPEVFIVSSLAFNPLYPKSDAYTTLIIQPSQDLESKLEQRQYVHITLPGFEPIGSIDPDNALLRNLPVEGNNPTSATENAATSYNTNINPVFVNPGKYDITTGKLVLEVSVGKTLLASKFTEVVICCFKLPAYSPLDSPAFRISAPTSLGDEVISIRDEAIKSSPYLDPGYQWEFLQIIFDPPVAKALTVIELTIRSANDLLDRCRIILHLSSITRETPGSGEIGFNTAASGDPSDWMFFAHLARWDDDARTITFFLREGKVLPKGKPVTLRTNPGEFRLPVEVESNWAGMKVEARSKEGDEIIRATPVMQSSEVPHVRRFYYTELTYLVNQPNTKTNVDFIFRTNRPMFVGTKVYARLSGFQAEVIEVPLKGALKGNFRGEIAEFSLPENLLTLHVSQTLFSDEVNAVVTLVDLILPPALYENDVSLLVWNSDPDCPKQSIDRSPEVGFGQKTFTYSKVVFSPEEPRRAANITFTLRPSIIFYQGDQIVFHLYGFLGFNTEVPLIGPGASRFVDSTARWYPGDHVLILTVAPNQIISNDQPIEVGIGKDSNFRLPDKLSRNDGILRVEGRGALILKEPVKKVPPIGGPKYVIDSRIEFEPVSDAENSVSRIVFSLIVNCDVLPNSTINITMGGILRHPPSCDQFGVNYCADRSGDVALSGQNAPLFLGGVGKWYQNEVKLSVTIIPTVQIYSGEMVRFFLERDQYFKLPAVAYPNDPSFRLAIPEAGVPEQPFNFSTRVAQVPKSFVVSDLFYGDPGSVAYPNTVVEMTIKFQPNVNLPEGSIVRITLPGFTSPITSIPLSSSEQQVNGELYIAEFIQSGEWDQLEYTLDIVVPPKRTIYRQLVAVMRIMDTYGFRLPSTPLLPNDPKLTIACIKNQIIYEEPIKVSPRVVDRTFMISQFNYRPPQKENIFLLEMMLQPTVNITDANDIVIQLMGFRNSLSKRNIHIMGSSRTFIMDSMAEWNETTSRLTMRVPEGEYIPAFTMLDLKIEESQGFILPASLNANDTRLRISSFNNIEPPEPIKSSPMVGNGPYSGHRLCMYQYERGVRTMEPICTAAADCEPPLTDPCSEEELERCGCNTRLDTVFPLTVMGFNLQAEDEIAFLPHDEPCGADFSGPSVLSSFSPPTSKTVSETRDRVEYHDVSSITTGYYRMCISHVGMVFDIGIIVVRPSCRVPLVLVGGACVEYCPKTKIPIAGDCRSDPHALEHTDSQALMVQVRMAPPLASGPSLADRQSDDPELKYFIYRYTYELGRLLNCDPKRIKVVSLSNGSVLVNTVFKTVGDEEAQAASTERTPLGLITLLRALQADQSSILYKSNFFKYIDRSYMPEPLPVRLCPDDAYRVFCPYTSSIPAWVPVVYVVFVLLVCVLVATCFAGAWHIDRDRPTQVNEAVLEKIRRNPREVEPPLQIEYAKSWLEGRFMGEDWQKARQVRFLAIGN